MPVLIKDFLSRANDRQRQLLLDMAAAAEKESRLSRQIELTSPQYFGTTDGLNVHICADEDDTRIVSAGPRQKLKRVEEQMKDYLREAVKDPQMRELGLVQRQYQQFFGEPIPPLSE